MALGLILATVDLGFGAVVDSGAAVVRFLLYLLGHAQMHPRVGGITHCRGWGRGGEINDNGWIGRGWARSRWGWGCGSLRRWFGRLFGRWMIGLGFMPRGWRRRWGRRGFSRRRWGGVIRRWGWGRFLFVVLFIILVLSFPPFWGVIFWVCPHMSIIFPPLLPFTTPFLP
jgi:hypothetical protein